MEADQQLSREQIAKLIEAHAQQCADDINNRDFTRSATGWRGMADFFQAESSHPEGGDGGSAVLNVDDYINMHKAIADANPEYHIKFVGLAVDVYYISGRGAQTSAGAQCFMTVESTGIPPGVVRQSVGVTTYRYMKGRWFCVHYAGVRGSLGHQSY